MSDNRFFFTDCMNVSFTNIWQNLRTQKYSSKVTDGTKNWMYQTEINFLTRKFEKFNFLNEDSREVQKFTDQKNS